jgi:hypothetical protein
MRYATLAERPDLVSAMWRMGNDWPEFMQHDPFGDVFFGRLPDVFPEWQQLLLNDDDRVVGKVNAIPFPWDGTDDDLPDRGWDAIMERGFAARRRGIPATAVSLLEARLAPDLLGGGHSRVMLEAMGARAVEGGLHDLFGPVRPSRKHEDPHAAMADYARATRTDGLPADPWLRVHVRMGGRVVKVAPSSMVIPGTLREWREWTGMPFDESGEVVVPFACNPVHVDLAQDHAVYVEPNVWVHHDLRSSAT